MVIQALKERIFVTNILKQDNLVLCIICLNSVLCVVSMERRQHMQRYIM